MHKKVKSRLINIFLISLVLIGVIGLMLKNFQDNVSFYLTTSEALQKNLDREFRLGGFVKDGSLEYRNDGLVRFTVTDFTNDIAVEYKGLLPDIFREGQGVVAIGLYKNKKFTASKVLAKHDENYVAVETKK